MKHILLIGTSLAFTGLAVAHAQTGDRLARQDSSETEVPEQQYGWQQEPRQIEPEEIERPLTELEKLSLSESGVDYGRSTYDPRSDNPLEPVSVTLRALDKITARYTDLVIDMDAESRFGTLAITPRTCDKRPPEEVPEITAFLEIRATDDFTRLPSRGAEDQLDSEAFEEEGPVVEDGTPAEPDTAIADPTDDDVGPTPASFSEVDARVGGLTDEDNDGDQTLFSGWMFASSPALNALEHPVYDIWVIDCKMVDPSI